MRKYFYYLLFVMVLAGAFKSGEWLTAKDTGQNGQPGRQVLYYVDPMNPAHTSPDPGLAPCGMKMEPVYADGAQPGRPAGAGSPPRSRARPASTSSAPSAGLSRTMPAFTALT